MSGEQLLDRGGGDLCPWDVLAAREEARIHGAHRPPQVAMIVESSQAAEKPTTSAGSDRVRSNPYEQRSIDCDVELHAGVRIIELDECFA